MKPIDVAVPTEAEREFHTEEFKQLCEEGRGLLRRVEDLFKASIGISAIVYSWLLTQSFGWEQSTGCTKLPRFHDVDLSGAWHLPCWITLLLAVLATSAFLRMIAIGKYMRQLEDVLGSKRLGWMAFQANGPWWVTGTVALAWACLALGTAAIGSELSTLSKALPPCVAPIASK